MNASRLISAAAASLSLFAGCVLVAAPAALAGEEGCPNEAIRAGQNATGLPECRAWELVTPAAKDNREAYSPEKDEMKPTEGFISSSSGERMAWVGQESLPPAKEVVGVEAVGTEYLSSRGPAGWSSEDMIPPQSLEEGLLCNFINNGVAGYTSDLSKAILADGAGQNDKSLGGVSNQSCGHNEPALVPEEPEGFENLFVRDDNALSYRLVDLTPSVVAPEDAEFDAVSADFSHVVFNENAPLVKGAPAITVHNPHSTVLNPARNGEETYWDDLYEWSAGAVHLVSYLKDGTAVHGTLPWSTLEPYAQAATPSGESSDEASASQFTHTVSADGSRIFFEAEGNLYVWEDAKATVQVDEAQGGAGPGGGGKFMAASADGSKVFFTDEASAGLTANTVPGSGENLYEYEVPVQDGTNGTLTDLTGSSSDARVLGLTAASEDGSYVYFVAEGVLPGTSGAMAGGPNLYVSHTGVTTFVVVLRGGPVVETTGVTKYNCDWNAQCSTARVSPDGRYLGFTSAESLTGYDNNAADEIYLYDAAANRLSCASCNPTGAPPVGNAFIRTPTKPSAGTLFTQTHLSRNVTDSGQVFFDTPDALVPKDSNGNEDVYMYKEGHVHLITSGTEAGASYFVDASENGSDVFFQTLQQLVRRDTDQSYDVYDARVDGGLLEQGYRPECGDEGCRGLASNPPVLSLPDSASLLSSGNVTPVTVVKAKAKPKSRTAKCKEGRVRKQDKCVKRAKTKAKNTAKGRK